MLNRFPKRQEIASVYAVIATMLFTWSVLLFLWYLPSWMHFMSVGDIAAVFCYIMSASFLEGTSFLIVLLVICFVVSPEYFLDEFIARGTAISLPAIGMMMVYFRITNENISKIIFTPIGLIVSLLVILISYFSANNRQVRQALERLAERLTVFLYVIIPVFTISIAVVVIRNLF